MPLVGYPKVIPYTKFEHWDHWFLSYAADKQTHGLEILRTPTDIVGVYNI